MLLTFPFCTSTQCYFNHWNWIKEFCYIRINLYFSIFYVVERKIKLPNIFCKFQIYFAKVLSKPWNKTELVALNTITLREKCPNMEFFLVRIFLHSDWIRRDEVSLRIQSEWGKIRTRKYSVFWHFSRSVISSLYCMNFDLG